MIQLGLQARMTVGACRVQPEIFLAIAAAESVMERYGLSTHIESLLDGKTSQHIQGYEVDLGVPADLAAEVATDLQTVLLDSYSVRSEGDKIHVVFTHT